MLQMIAERRQQLEQQLLDIQQMQLELDTAEERCRTALESTGQASRQLIRRPSRLPLIRRCALRTPDFRQFVIAPSKEMDMFQNFGHCRMSTRAVSAAADTAIALQSLQ